MATYPYTPRQCRRVDPTARQQHTTTYTAVTTDPIVIYARQIKKNTAEFTAKDLRKYIRWLHARKTA